MHSLEVVKQYKKVIDLSVDRFQNLVVPYFEISSSTDYAEVLTICVICG